MVRSSRGSSSVCIRPTIPVPSSCNVLRLDDTEMSQPGDFTAKPFSLRRCFRRAFLSSVDFDATAGAANIARLSATPLLTGEGSTSEANRHRQRTIFRCRDVERIFQRPRVGPAGADWRNQRGETAAEHRPARMSAQSCFRLLRYASETLGSEGRSLVTRNRCATKITCMKAP